MLRVLVYIRISLLIVRFGLILDQVIRFAKRFFPWIGDDVNSRVKICGSVI